MNGECKHELRAAERGGVCCIVAGCGFDLDGDEAAWAIENMMESCRLVISGNGTIELLRTTLHDIEIDGTIGR